MDDPRSQPRKEWPDWVREPLEKVGITPYETVDSIRPKIESLGFRIVSTTVDHGGRLSTRPLFHAQVMDPRREDGVLGEYWSATDFAEALAWATAQVIQDNEENEEDEEDGP